ncbi:hypothetical protein HJG60_011285 [Phyllostomus discolor]|uniref:Uncharacterized protein n=1 Tax=Phyllostomus discolor TaxID=89673 RepID=A0A834A2A9_9CHIR|nr:hypothetical protein HJG60_011285 [Phyllostomus discolor]
MTSKYRSSAPTELLTHFLIRPLDISMAMSNKRPHTWIGVNRALTLFLGPPPSTLHLLRQHHHPLVAQALNLRATVHLWFPPFPSHTMSVSQEVLSVAPLNITCLHSLLHQHLLSPSEPPPPCLAFSKSLPFPSLCLTLH